MILIKLWWSLIAPKHKTWYIDKKYIEIFSQTIKKLSTILVHGTGNVWHGFIEKHGLSPNSYNIGRKKLDDYFWEIDKIVEYNRVRYTNNIDRKVITKNTIIGWDITTDFKIISSDRIFAEILAHKDISLAIIATDIDGVLDDKNNIIPIITEDNINTIHFRSKDGDVTGSMKEKIQQLIKHNQGSNKIVRICNGYNLENLNKIITTNQWIGTQVLL